jgi:hypothetical protein
MAVDMFLVLEHADLKGETQDTTYKDKGGIDVLAWSWGMSQSGTFHVGGGSGAGKVNVQDISITKYVDKASPILMLFCCRARWRGADWSISLERGIFWALTSRMECGRGERPSAGICASALPIARS